MTAKITTLRTLYVHVVLNSVMFPQILYILYARHFPPVKFFSQVLLLLTLFFFELPQNVTFTDEQRA